jgi:hypothetical protein
MIVMPMSPWELSELDALKLELLRAGIEPLSQLADATNGRLVPTHGIRLAWAREDYFGGGIGDDFLIGGDARDYLFGDAGNDLVDCVPGGGVGPG